METEYYYSLCITIKWENGYYELLRFADILMSEENKGVRERRLLPYTDDSNKPFVSTIKMDPKKAEENELGVWKWWQNEGNQKTQSESYTKLEIYELLFPETVSPEIIEEYTMPISSLLRKLVEGFEIRPKQQFPLLYTIAWSSEEYWCVEITKSTIILTDTKIKIPIKTQLNFYRILKSDCISSSECLQKIKRRKSKQSLSTSVQNRVVYNKTRLPREPDLNLIVQGIDAYLDEFLNSLKNSVKYTPDRISLISDFLKSECGNTESFVKFIQKYYNPNGNTQLVDLFAQWYSERGEILNKYFSEKNQGSSFLQDMIENIPEMRERYTVHLLKNLEDERKQISHEIQNLKKQKEELIHSIKLDESEKKKLETLISKMRDDNDKLTRDLFQKIENIKEILYTLGVQPRSVLNQDQRDIYHISPSQLLEWDLDEPEELLTHKDVADLLCDNLLEIGIGDKHNVTNSIGYLITSTYLMHFPLLLIGKNSKKVAEVVAYFFTGQLPELIVLKTGYENYQELKQILQKSTAPYVILGNTVASAEEYTYFHLHEEFPKKHFIYTLEFAATLSLLPLETITRFLVLNTDLYVEIPKGGKLVSGILDLSETPEKIDSTYISGKLHKLLNGSGLPKEYFLTRAALLHSVTSSRDDMGQSLHYLYPELKSIGEIYPFPEKFLETLDMGEPEQKKLKAYLFQEEE